MILLDILDILDFESSTVRLLDISRVILTLRLRPGGRPEDSWSLRLFEMTWYDCHVCNNQNLSALELFGASSKLPSPQFHGQAQILVQVMFAAQRHWQFEQKCFLTAWDKGLQWTCRMTTWTSWNYKTCVCCSRRKQQHPCPCWTKRT